MLARDELVFYGSCFPEKRMKDQRKKIRHAPRTLAAFQPQAPAPDQAEELLAALEKQIRPEEKQYFGDLWEAFPIASDNQ